MIQTAFNTFISSNTLLLEEAKTKVRDSVEAEFKTRIQQEISTPETINSILQSPSLNSIQDLQRLEVKFNQLKSKCDFLKQQVDNKINQLQAINNKVEKINTNFSKLNGAIEIANNILPTLKIIVSTAPVALAFFTGPFSNALAEKKINDGLDIAKSKIKELAAILAVFIGVKTYIDNQTSQIDSQVNSALLILENLKITIEQNCNYIDIIFLQKIAEFSNLIDTDTITTKPTPIFNNPEEILSNLENSSKEKFFQYIRDIEGNTGYKIIKK